MRGLLHGNLKESWWFRKSNQVIRSVEIYQFAISFSNMDCCWSFFLRKNLIMYSSQLIFWFWIIYLRIFFRWRWHEKYMPSHMHTRTQSILTVVTDNTRKWQNMIIDYTNLALWVTRRGILSTSQLSEDQIF